VRTTAANEREEPVDAKQRGEPDNTAVRVALWRALHVQADSPPHVFVDDVGLRLVAPHDAQQANAAFTAQDLIARKDELFGKHARQPGFT